MTLAILAALFAATSLLVLPRKGPAGVRAGLGVWAGLPRPRAPPIPVGRLGLGFFMVWTWWWERVCRATGMAVRGRSAGAG